MGAEGDVADENTAVLLQKRQECAQKVDFLRVRQVVERVGRDDGVVLPCAKLGHKAFGKIALIEPRVRHFCLRQFDHARGKVLPIDAAALLVEPRGQNACAKANVQHITPALRKHALIERVHHGTVARKWVAVVFVGEADALVIAVGPEVEAGIVQHVSPPFRSAGEVPAHRTPRRSLRRH